VVIGKNSKFQKVLLKVLIISIVFVGLAFAGFAIKILLTKNGEFKKSCSSVDPTTGERYGCSCGIGDGGEACDNSRQQAVDS
jgi:hypothetical protein